MRELRFGVGRGDGGSGSRYWNLRSAAKRPDLYLRGNRTGAFFGVSFHEDPDHWHWKIHRPNSPPEYKAWRRPPPFVPGYTRAIELVAHVSEGEQATPFGHRRQVVWYQPQTIGRIHFAIWIEERGANLAGWPGKNHGTSLIGRIEIADGTTAVVVASESEHEEQSWTMPVPGPRWRAQISDQIRQAENPRMILMGIGDGGTAWMVDAPLALRDDD